MNIGISTATSAIPVRIAGSTGDASSSTDAGSTSASGTQASTSASGTQASGKAAGGAGGTGNAGAASSSDDSSTSSTTVQALQKEITQLQKQLTQQEQQLQQASAGSNAKDPAALAQVSSLQSAVATTSGQLSSLVVQLAAAVEAEGGSSTGTLVSTTA